MGEPEWSALRCRILGTFFLRDGKLRLGSDVENFLTSVALAVYRPTGAALEMIVNYISPERAAELARRLPPFVTPVLLFVNEDTTKIVAACSMVAGATVQFHGDESPAHCLAAAQQAARPYLRAARIPVAPDRPGPDLLKFAEDYATAQALLLDAEVDGYGGGGKTFPWSRLPTNVNAHLVLGGGLTPANVTDGIVQLRSRLRPGKTLAVDVSSGVELSKGIKDPEKMRQFVAAVRAADALA